MELFYLIYLLVVLFSSFLIIFVAKLKIDLKKAFLAILPPALVFIIWDIVATERGHWEFGLDKMLGIVIINQPIEELAFFLVIPLFYIVAWETIRKFM